MADRAWSHAPARLAPSGHRDAPLGIRLPNPDESPDDRCRPGGPPSHGTVTGRRYTRPAGCRAAAPL